MIEVRDTKSVPLTAQRVREAFEIANIMPANFVPPDIEFVILSDRSQFVGISLPLSLIPLRLQLVQCVSLRSVRKTRSRP
jgi:hypothetical protein